MGFPAPGGTVQLLGQQPGIWLLDTQTGSLAWCLAAKNTNDVPMCSPWATTPGDGATFRYDPVSGNLIPMNEAARKLEPAPSAPNDPLGIR